MHVKLYSDEHGVVGFMVLVDSKNIKKYILKAYKKKFHSVFNLQDFLSTGITERGSSLFDWLC